MFAGRGLGEVGVAVGEGSDIPAHHARTAPRFLAFVDREWVRAKALRSSRAAKPRRRCEIARLAVAARCSAVSQSRHIGPGGATKGAAMTGCPQIAR